MNRRVVVTGLGIVSPIGHTLEEAWDHARSGTSGISMIDSPFVKVSGRLRSQPEFPPDFMPLREERNLPEFLRSALAASQSALADAKWESNQYLAERVGSVIGMIGSDAFGMERHSKYYYDTQKVLPSVAKYGSIMAPAFIAKQFQFLGNAFVASSACSSSNHAIMSGLQEIQLGRQDMMLVGGLQGPTSEMQYANFSSSKAYTKSADPQSACKPFDAERDGIVIGEGAGILILEEYENAKARGRKIYAEIVGSSGSMDAAHIIQPSGTGAAICMRRAMEEARISPEQVGHINAHATGTVLGDEVETEAIKKAFGKWAYEIPITAPKAIVGHLLGAAGAVEAIISILALKHQIVPPTANLKTPDPKCDLNCVGNGAISRPMEYALNNSFGFGGTNTSVIFKLL